MKIVVTMGMENVKARGSIIILKIKDRLFVYNDKYYYLCRTFWPYPYCRPDERSVILLHTRIFTI